MHGGALPPRAPPLYPAVSLQLRDQYVIIYVHLSTNARLISVCDFVMLASNFDIAANASGLDIVTSPFMTVYDIV